MILFVESLAVGNLSWVSDDSRKTYPSLPPRQTRRKGHNRNKTLQDVENG